MRFGLRQFSSFLIRHKFFSAIAALILLTFLLRLTWGWYVDRQLSAHIAQIRARGEPVYPSDIVIEPVPDADNAAILYRQAMAALVESVESPRQSNLEYPDYPPYSADWMKLAEASEKAHAKVFALARAARSPPRVQFHNTVKPDVDIAQLDAIKALANVLADAAQFAHVTGNDVEAVERLLDLLYVARASRSDQYLVSHMIGTSIDALACNSIQHISSGLRFDANTAPELSAKVRKLIAELLDEEQIFSTLHRGFLDERIRFIQWYTTTAIEDRWLIAPLSGRDLVRALPNLGIMLEAAKRTSFPQAQQVLHQANWEPVRQPLAIMFTSRETEIPRYSRWFLSGGGTAGYFQRVFRSVAERRLTALALACQLYRADHGSWPQSGNQLLARYISAVPLDPFSSDRAAIGYIVRTHAPPLKGDRPLLFFDPTGKDVPLKPEPIYGWYSNPTGSSGGDVRQYRDISHFTPPKLPKTVNYYPGESNTPRDDAEEGYTPN